MIYSVWNQGASSFDYYESPDVQSTLNTPAPSHIPRVELGATIDQAAWPLPADAQRVGSGPYAKGRVASLHKGQPLGSFSLASTNTVLFAGIGLVGFFLWKKGVFE